ncbi:MAG: ester cyclase [Terriglobales bacterium]
MSGEKDNAQFIHRWFDEVWNKGRMEAIDELCRPDAIGHGQAQHKVDIGLVEFKQFARDLRTAFPDIRITIHETLAQGDKVVARWSAKLTHSGSFLGFAPTGREAQITGTSIQRIVDGKIAEGWDNWDQLGLLVQIGAVPAAQFVSEKSAKAS